MSGIFPESEEFIRHFAPALFILLLGATVFLLFRILRGPAHGLQGERELLRRLRATLVFWYAFLTLLTVFVLGISVYYSQANLQINRVRNDLLITAVREAGDEDTIRDLQNQASNSGEAYHPNSPFSYPSYTITRLGKVVEAATATAQPIRGLPDLTSFRQTMVQGSPAFAEVSNGALLVYNYPVFWNGQVLGGVQVAASTSSFRYALGDLLEAFFGAAMVAIFLAVGVGYFLAGRALGPIRQAFSQQRNFVADASHELRTPLTILRTNAELALRSPTKGHWREALETTISQTKHMTRLVEDLSILARSDSGQLTLEMVEVDLANLGRNLLLEMETIAQEKRVKLADHLPGSLLVMGDVGKLRQLLIILLDNAIKYTPAGGKVTLTACVRGRKAEVTVVDTGIGIPQNLLGNIFNRFYRIDKARSRESGGTGLGLAIAKWIVRAHGGELGVESQVDKGSAFTVQLPLLPTRP